MYNPYESLHNLNNDASIHSTTFVSLRVLRIISFGCDPDQDSWKQVLYSESVAFRQQARFCHLPETWTSIISAYIISAKPYLVVDVGFML